MEYNPNDARRKTSPEQQIIRANRNLEYDRKFKKSAEDRLNQEKEAIKKDKIEEVLEVIELE